MAVGVAEPPEARDTRAPSRAFGSPGRISLQVILAVVAASTLVFGLSSYLILRGQRAALISQVDHQAHLVSETIKSSTRYAMLLNRREDVHQIIDTIGLPGRDRPGPDLQQGRSDHLLARQVACRASSSTSKPRPATRVTPPTSRSSGCRGHSARASSPVGGGRQLGIINPIYNEPSCWQASCHAHAEDQTVLGVLDVTMSLDRGGPSAAPANGRRQRS